MSRAFPRAPFLLRLKFNAERLVLRRVRCHGMNNVQLLGMVAFGSDLSGRHEFAVIAPRAALIVDDIRYVDIVEDAERRHRTGVQHGPGFGALSSIEHHVYVFCRIVFGDDAASLDRRICTGAPLTICPVTGGALGGGWTG